MNTKDGSLEHRQGIYIDPIALWIKKTLLNPLLMGGISAFLHWGSKTGTISFLQNPSQNRHMAMLAAVLSAVGVLIRANDHLTTQYHNNWTVDDSWNWDDEIVLITGGSSGIGATVAQQLLALNEKTRIIILDYSPLAFTPPAGSKLYYYRCDLSKAAEIKATCATVRSDVGDPTVIFNNAGLTRGATVMEGSYADVEITFKTNIIAPFLILKEFLPAMVKRNHGHIVATSSMSAIVPPAGLADYGATKSGLITLHEALAQELRFKHNAPKIRLSLIVLSFVSTPMFKGDVPESDFLTPLMTVNTVGDYVVKILLSGYGKNIYLPGLMRYVTSVRGWPEWMLRIMANDTNNLKVDYVGRQKVDLKTGHLS